MRAALAVCNGRISPVFDVSRNLLLLDVRDRTVADRCREKLPEEAAAGKAARLAELKVHTLICGAISRPMAALLAAYGVTVIPFIAGDEEEVIAAFLSGALPQPALSMPGCRCAGRGRPDPEAGGRGAAPAGWGGRNRRGPGPCRGRRPRY
jgi:predicted Fe-Mo cluster-binding NifX family protein